MSASGSRSHEEFKTSTEYPYSVHDIAVLKIKSSDFQVTVQYAKIAEPEDVVLNQKLILAGFGPSVTDPDFGLPLRQVEMSLKSLDSKNKLFSVGWDSSENKGLNLGDSGGPVYLLKSQGSTIAGVISTGDGFTIVPSYKDWLSVAILQMGGELFK